MHQQNTRSATARSRRPLRPRSAVVVALARQERVPSWYLWLRRIAERFGSGR